MDDLISRQQAIDAINKALDRETLLNRLVRQVAVDAVRMVSTVHCEDCPYKERRESEKTNKQFESCDDCIYSDVEESVCVQLKCIHAVGGLSERYTPKATADTSEWIPLDTYMGQERYICRECGEITKDTVMGKPRARFCPWCGRRME